MAEFPWRPRDPPDPSWVPPRRDLGLTLRALESRRLRFVDIRDVTRYIIVPMVLWPGHLRYGGPGGSILVEWPNGTSYVDGVRVGYDVDTYSRRGDRVNMVRRRHQSEIDQEAARPDREYWARHHHILNVESFPEFHKVPGHGSYHYCNESTVNIDHVMFGDSPTKVHLYAGIISLSIMTVGDVWKHAIGGNAMTGNPQDVVITGDLFLQRFVNVRVVLSQYEYTLWDGGRRVWIAVGVPKKINMTFSLNPEERRAAFVPEFMPHHTGGPVTEYSFQYTPVAVWRGGGQHIYGLTAWGALMSGSILL